MHNPTTSFYFFTNQPRPYSHAEDCIVLHQSLHLLTTHYHTLIRTSKTTIKTHQPLRNSHYRLSTSTQYKWRPTTPHQQPRHNPPRNTGDSASANISIYTQTPTQESSRVRTLNTAYKALSAAACSSTTTTSPASGTSPTPSARHSETGPITPSPSTPVRV